MQDVHAWQLLATEVHSWLEFKYSSLQTIAILVSGQLYRGQILLYLLETKETTAGQRDYALSVPSLVHSVEGGEEQDVKIRLQHCKYSC